jgi:hypothetical protein
MPARPSEDVWNWRAGLFFKMENALPKCVSSDKKVAAICT